MELSILLPAFAAGIVVLLSHIPLGKEVLKRGIIFIDLAIAQFAGLGIVVAYYFGFHAHGLEIQLFALLGAMVGAFLLSVTDRFLHSHQEAGIGILFVLAATGSLLLIANTPHGNEQLQNILIGHILWAEWGQLIPALLVGIFILTIYFKAKSIFQSKWFYLLFAFAITQSVQLIGVYLVFATLIIPALASTKLGTKSHFLVPFTLGSVSYAVGLTISSFIDLPSGAVIVWIMALLSLILLVSTTLTKR